jgi:hypothetical protein
MYWKEMVICNLKAHQFPSSAGFWELEIIAPGVTIDGIDCRSIPSHSYRGNFAISSSYSLP